MSPDTAEAAARTMIEFWTGPRTFDPSRKELCVRLARMVDPAGALASIVRENPDESVGRVGAVIRVMSREPAVTGLVGQIVPGFVMVPDDPAPEARAGWTDRPLTGGAILFVSSDPRELDRLSLGREEREIREALDLSRGRRAWALHSWAATRLRDLTRSLLEVKPRIVHFSGHGNRETGLYLQDEAGRAQCVPPDALADLFSVIGKRVECVVLNACYSEPQARAIAAHVPFVVGSPSEVVDEAAIAYSVGFYQLLGDGATFAESHQVACIHMQGAGTLGCPLPVLIEAG